MIKRDKRIKVMREMLDLLKQQGYERASLAVQKANYAVRMYETVGFQNVGENEEYRKATGVPDNTFMSCFGITA